MKRGEDVCPKTTWADKVRSRAFSLSSNQDQVDALCEGFMFVAAEWATMPMAKGLPFPCGITSHGDPVELSVRGLGARDASLRFIAQPGRFGIPSSKDKRFARARAIEFAVTIVGPYGAAIVDAACALLCYSVQERGNFFIWLGLDVSSTNCQSLKLYINPDAGSSGYDGLALAESLVAVAGFRSIVPFVSRLHELNILTNPHIVGLNISSTGIESCKVYFPIYRASYDELLNLFGRVPELSSVEDSLRLLSKYLAFRQGQVHISCVWRGRDRLPEVNVSLYCQDWFDSDAQILAATGNKDILKADHNVDSKMMRTFTFLGVRQLPVIYCSI